MEHIGSFIEHFQLPMIHPFNQNTFLPPLMKIDLINGTQNLNRELMKHINEAQEETEVIEHLVEREEHTKYLDKILEEKDMEIMHLKLDNRTKESEIKDLKRTTLLQEHMLYENKTQIKESAISTAATLADVLTTPKPKPTKEKSQSTPWRNLAQEEFMEYKTYKYLELLGLIWHQVSYIEQINRQFIKEDRTSRIPENCGIERGFEI